MALPDEVETRVVTRLFNDAERLGWADMRPRERTAQYAAWVADAEVGGLLARFMTAEQARLWIKDGPMKEWARAVAGVGKHAPLVPGLSAGPGNLVRKALGPDWEILPDSLQIKPLRVRAARGEKEKVTFAWGPERDLKHLVWAALHAGANGDSLPWVLCVTASFTKPVPANVRQADLRIAKRCGLRLLHVTV